MHRSLRWWLPLAVVTVVMSLGCSKEVAAPRTQDAIGLAPLITGAPGARQVDGEYIVVFKDNVADVSASVGELGQRHGFKARFSYAHAIKGFAGKLAAPATPATPAGRRRRCAAPVPPGLRTTPDSAPDR